MKYFILTLLLLSSFGHANSVWTEFKDVGVIYTYNDKDSLYVYLQGVSCPNTKNYFTITSTQQENASQLISMVLAAKMAKVKVNILYNPSESSDFCFIRGLQLQN